MGDPVKKIGADYFTKLRQQLLNQKRTIHEDKRFKFDINHVKSKPNVSKPFKRGPKLSIPFLDHKFPSHLRRNLKTSSPVTTSSFEAQDAEHRPKRKVETFVNLPPDFFSESSNAPLNFPNFSMFEPEIQITEADRSVGLANSTIFDPPVTSTPFGAIVEEGRTDPAIQELSLDGIFLEPSKDTASKGYEQDHEELHAYQQYVEAVAQIGAAADKVIFFDTPSEFQKAKEYLQKVFKRTAPSPAVNPTRDAKMSYFTELSSPTSFCTADMVTPMQVDSDLEMMFSPPSASHSIFGQFEKQPRAMRNVLSMTKDPFLFETTTPFDNGRPAQIALNSNQEMTFFGTPVAVQVQQKQFDDTFNIIHDANRTTGLFGTPVAQTMDNYNGMDTFEETFDRNLSGYRKLIAPCSPPNFTQLLNDETIHFQYEPRNVLDRRNQFVVRRQMPQNQY